VLDPIVAIRNSIVIGPNDTVRAHFVTGVAETREGAIGLIEKYCDRHLADRVFELAWTQSQVVLRQLDATQSDTQLYGRLASSILYANPLLRAAGSVIARNRRGQSGLWGYGISGDLPIVLLRVGDVAHMHLVRQLVQAHAYWRVRGLTADLVIWNEDQSGYRQVLQDQIMTVIASRAEANLLDRPGGIFVRRIEQMSEEDKILMQTVARVIINDTAGTLAEQIDRRARTEVPVARFSPIRQRAFEPPVAVEVHRRDLAAFNGAGGFTQDGREYVITTTDSSPTPAPWCNVLANPWFGTVVSESGGAYTWCENAHAYRLTPWHNDPVSDVSGEAFYIRDEASGRFWSPTPLPAPGAMPYTTRHGFGYSIFEYSEAGIRSEMWERTVSVAQEHMATAVIRRVLGWLFRVYEVRGTAPRLVVSTPPGQVHELGALMVAASAAAEGWAVTYLGPNLPVADLVSAVGQAGARAAAISAVHRPEGSDLMTALRDMRAGLPQRVPLLVGGAGVAGVRREAEAAGAVVIESLPELRALLRRLAAGEAG
jgi:cellobiose phosphorylase/methylmalonyl-CoA mutase cobalamin-binding subunit